MEETEAVDVQTNLRMMTTRRKKTRDEMNWLNSGFFERGVIMLVGESGVLLRKDKLWLE